METTDTLLASTSALLHFDSHNNSLGALSSGSPQIFNSFGSTTSNIRISDGTNNGTVRYSDQAPTFTRIGAASNPSYTTTANGNGIRSLYFDGTSYLSAPFVPGTWLGTDGCSVSCFFKPTGNPAGTTLFRISNGSANANTTMYCSINGSGLLELIGFNTLNAQANLIPAAAARTNFATFVDPGSVIYQNEWHFIMFSYCATTSVWSWLSVGAVVHQDGNTMFRTGTTYYPAYFSTAGVPDYFMWGRSGGRNIRTFTNSTITVGSGWAGAAPFTGYISDLQIWKAHQKDVLWPTAQNTVNPTEIGLFRYTSAGTQVYTNSGLPNGTYYYSDPIGTIGSGSGFYARGLATALIDNSTSKIFNSRKLAVTTGTVTITSAVSKFNSSSLLFNGTGYLRQVLETSSTTLVTNRCVEFHVRFTSVSNAVLYAEMSYSSPLNRLAYYIWFRDGNLCVGFTLTGLPDDFISYPWTPSANVWYAIAVQKVGKNVYLFVDGTLAAEAIKTFNNGGGTQSEYNWGIAIGGVSNSQYPTGHILNGYIDEFRITDANRYGVPMQGIYGDYTVKSSAFTNAA